MAWYRIHIADIHGWSCKDTVSDTFKVIDSLSVTDVCLFTKQSDNQFNIWGFKLLNK